jgi:hypothetical protein
MGFGNINWRNAMRLNSWILLGCSMLLLCSCASMSNVSEKFKTHEKAIADSKRARLITLVWLRAHQKMASGVTEPAEWFDINTLPAQLFKLGTKLAF